MDSERVETGEEEGGGYERGEGEGEYIGESEKERGGQGEKGVKE